MATQKKATPLASKLGVGKKTAQKKPAPKAPGKKPAPKKQKAPAGKHFNSMEAM